MMILLWHGKRNSIKFVKKRTQRKRDDWNKFEAIIGMKSSNEWADENNLVIIIRGGIEIIVGYNHEITTLWVSWFQVLMMEVIIMVKVNSWIIFSTLLMSRHDFIDWIEEFMNILIFHFFFFLWQSRGNQIEL